MTDGLTHWLVFEDSSMCAPRANRQYPVEQKGDRYIVRMEWDYKGGEESMAAQWIRARLESAKKSALKLRLNYDGRNED